MKTLNEMVIDILKGVAVGNQMVGVDKPRKNEHVCRLLYQCFNVRISERTLRVVYKDINEQFIRGESEYMVVSNAEGSYLTKDPEEIRRFNVGRRNQAFSLLHGAYQSEKRLAKNMNLSFEEYIRQASENKAV